MAGDEVDSQGDIETMETPGASRADRRWNRLHATMLDAVFDLVSERRGDDVAVTEVAERADVAQGTFYNHFADFATALDETLDRDLCDYDAAVDTIVGPGMDAVDRWAVQTGVIVHRLLRQPGWAHFSFVSYRTPRWPRPGQRSESHRSIDAGVDDGSMHVSDPDLAYHLTHHLKLAVADRVADGPGLELEQTLRDVLAPGLAMLGVEPARLDDILEWLLPGLESLDWTRADTQLP